MDILVEEFRNFLSVEKGASPNTIEAYMRDIGRFMEFAGKRGRGSLERVRRDDITAFMVSEKRRGLSASSIARSLAALMMLFKFLAANKYIRKDIAGVLESPKLWKYLPDILSPEEVEKLLKAPDTSKQLGRRDRAILELMYASGLRVSEAAGMLKAGKITEEDYLKLEDEATPTCGSCSFLGTANTMCCIAEAMGMSLPGSGTIPATHAERLRAAQATGRRIVEMVHEGLAARQIIDRRAVENGIRLSTAIGGSTNTALHLPAIAYEAECDLDMDQFESLCRTTPHIAKMNPAAAANVPDFHRAGGVQAVMKEILHLVHGDALTVTGKTVAQNLEGVPDGHRSIVRPTAEPWSEGGGLAILRGNLAPDTAITKPAAIVPEMQTFTGRARCFDSEVEANQAILDGAVQEGEVVVIRYEGPKGGPGMREMYSAMKFLYGRGLALKTALVTDGRFSGTNNGCFVGHISPEAAEGGPLALVRDGDEIAIDIPGRRLDLRVGDDELERRRQAWQRPEPKIRSGYLALYARLAESADKGAVIRHRD